MVRINLIPIRSILRKRELKEFGVMTGAILAVAVVIAAGVYFLVSTKVGNLQRELAAEQARLTDLRNKNKEINTLSQQLARLKSQVTTIEKLTKERVSPVRFMEALSHALPDEVWINTLTNKKKNFELTGTGIDDTAIVKFVRDLQRVRKDFTQNRLFVYNEGKEPTFFANVKLLQTVQSKGKKGLGAKDFKIVGSIR